MKSSRSMNSSRVKGSLREPAAGESERNGASISSTLPLSQFSTTTLSGRCTQSALFTETFSTSRSVFSSSSTSTVLSALATPIRSQKRRMASAV